MSVSRQLPPSVRRVKDVLVLLAVVCLAAGAAAQLEPDSLETRDSLTTDASALELLADSSGVAPDSALTGGVMRRWLQPMGVMLIAGTTFLLLYTVRSK